jgi:hypothetical protein
MRLYQWIFRISMVLMLVALTACSVTATPTITVQRTRATRAPTEVTPTDTPVPTSTPVPTDTPTPTNTVAPSATIDPAVAALGCNAAAFAGNITYFDGTKVGPGGPFTKTWQIRNTGNCTWNSNYTLVFVNGTRFGGQTAVSIPGPIAPGSYVTVSANLVAPMAAGTYTSYWMMRNDSGQFFGFGPVGKDPIHVTILIMDLGAANNTPKP